VPVFRIIGQLEFLVTEVVLQGFRGVITLLDRAVGQDGGELSSDEASDKAGVAAPQVPVGGVRRSSADMDDEIPF
jgi:hypothetical protein